ncbi:Golgi phosphoprotein 3 GPP34 [Nonomuraea polychroma]|uniref:Golgi phosphoprotein 3 GPP34 n=1 Tax=Nonomuraea polychroma TaxID=46176 RepID=A0A438LZ51_9ACTN|nr:GPP34 family phosphoprotein [Nonomuraea polychroma]RVX38844.1 Golgi phosphoprotein 3 GPP34 [Nonomuraea polychroma]
MATEQLTFAEELMLLAHRETDGKQLIPNNVLNISLTAAELAELAALGKVEVRGADLAVVDRRPVGDAELDAVLARMVKVGKTLPAGRWLIMINPVRKHRNYLRRLSERGAFKADRSRMLGLIPVERYGYDDTTLVRAVKDRIGKVIRGQKPDARTVTLLALAHGSGVLGRLANPGKRVEQLVQDDWAGQAVKAYVDKTTTKPDDSGDSVTILAAGGS